VSIPAPGGQVNITFNGSGSGLDLYMAMLRPTGGVFRFVDDGSALPEPGFDSYLPPGDYFLVVGEYFQLPGAFTFQVGFTPGAAPALACGGSQLYTTAGPESVVLYRVQAGTSQTLTFTTSPGSINDTYLTLYDSSLAMMFFVDDDGANLLSRLVAQAPAGTYYIGCEAFAGGAGNATVSLACSAAAPVNANFGANGGNIVNPGDCEAWLVKAGTPGPMEFSTDVAGGGLDSMMCAVDAAGRVIAFDDDGGPGLASYAGNAVATGDHWVLVRGYNNDNGAYRLDVKPPLYMTDAVNDRRLNVLDKGGRGMLTFVGLNALPFGLPVPAPFTGLLLFDPSAFLQLPIIVVPSTGQFQYPIDFQPFPNLAIQALSLTIVPLGGRMTDLVR
jgi:hypothetical protein